MKSLARQNDKSEVLRRLRTVRPETTRRWGRMTAHQMVCHMADAFRMAIGQRPTPVDANLFQRTALKWLVLHVPVPWPPGITTNAELDPQRGGTKPGDFAADVAQVEALLEAFATHGLERPLHPVFGKMSNTDWLRWGYLHMDHHLRQFGA
jgi:hypothetical protein